MVIGGVGVLTLTRGVLMLVKNVVSSEPSVHYDLRLPGVCPDISGAELEIHEKIPSDH